MGPYYVGILLFLFINSLNLIILSAEAVIDDGVVIKELASLLSPTPLGWTTTGSDDYCTWHGVACNKNGRIIIIDLALRSLSGTLPRSLNSLSQLTRLSLQNNDLTGPLPTLANLTFLEEIHLDFNNFTSIPIGCFSGLTSLRILSLSGNANLAPWEFPSELSRSSSNLVTLDAMSVNMMGFIPDIFSSFPRLQNLKLSYNNLTGSLPGSFSGSVIQNMWLNGQESGLYGPIDVLSGMTELSQVWLQDNLFTGPIPDLSLCTQLFDLQLGDNRLTGVVPLSVFSLPRLVNITLGLNMLQGPVPHFPKTVAVDIRDLETSNNFCRKSSGDCDPQVSTMLQIAGALGYPMKMAKTWKGNNACNNWVFLTCDVNGTVTAVNFAKQGFSGTISPAFANLTSLRELRLMNNNLTGPIPESLTSLPHLTRLDVSNNSLSGQIPNFRPEVILLHAGNKLIKPSSNGGIRNTTRPSPNGASSDSPTFSSDSPSFWRTWKIVLVILVPIMSLILLLLFYTLLNQYKKRKRKISDEVKRWGDHSFLAPDLPVRFSYEVLKVATNNFDMNRKLGSGGFGSVFEGTLSDGSKIAAKRLDRLGQGRKEFLAEVNTIGSIHHINLVKLIGFCVENTHRILVYEYMSNGSLDKWIFRNDLRPSLAWDTRKKIILHIAKGLAYLHEECQRKIAHLDIKPQNVLLDDSFNAKLSDFGLAKLIDRDQSFVMTQMRGTRGYLAPEWLGRKITEKVDVYSYGVVVLEVIFGRKNLDFSPPQESDNLLVNIVRKKAEASRLDELLESCSEDVQENGEEVLNIIKLATWCLHSDSGRRPFMSRVIKILEGEINMDFAIDCSYLFPQMDGTSTLDATTQISACVLSGPR